MRPLQHDWAVLESSADSVRSRRLDQPGAAAEFLALGEDLHRHVARLNPAWPTAADAAERFADLLRLKERIDRAGRLAR